MTVRILDIIFETMVDGVGLRTSVYFAGCKHHCKGCHNPQSWDMNGGYEVTLDYLMDLITDDEFADVTFSGGDPLYQCEAVTELARRIKTETNKTIWCYTGFTYEEIVADESLSKILPYIDVLVDGPFIENLKTDEISFVGSSNQRKLNLVGGVVVSPDTQVVDNQ
jgi:anaerobic ribonucleoside-triphosphate reductase activating protein